MKEHPEVRQAIDRVKQERKRIKLFGPDAFPGAAQDVIKGDRRSGLGALVDWEEAAMLGASIPFFVLTKGRYKSLYDDVVKKFPTDSDKFTYEATKKMEGMAVDKLNEGMSERRVSQWMSQQAKQIEKFASDIWRGKQETIAEFDKAVARLEKGKPKEADAELVRAVVLEPLTPQQAKLIREPEQEAVFQAVRARYMAGKATEDEAWFLETRVWAEKAELREVAWQKHLATMKPEKRAEMEGIRAMVRSRGYAGYALAKEWEALMREWDARSSEPKPARVNLPSFDEEEDRLGLPDEEENTWRL